MFVPCLVLTILVQTVFTDALGNECFDPTNSPNPLPSGKVLNITQRGNLYSPGFEKGENYPNSIRCIYQINAPSGMHVRLKFNSLDIEATAYCKADSLMIYDFNSQRVEKLYSVLCGKQVPYDYVSSVNIVKIILQTDQFGARKGFNITYSVSNTSDVCSVGMKQCKNRNCVASARVCDGNDDCGDGTDEEKCSQVIQPGVCGKPEINPVSLDDYDRIVGGQKVVAGSWPWMADLQKKLYEPNGHKCGGSLINAQWVLSAAHCFAGNESRNPEFWRIHLGNYRKFDRDDSEQIRYVERIIIYDDIPSSVFEQNGKYDIVHDIALIKLNAPVKFTKYVQPVCIPNSLTKQPAIGTKCYATGWGATRGTGSSHLLKQSYHPVQSGVMCGRLVGKRFNPETMICAGSMEAFNGVCHGDSGGPLVCLVNKQWQVFGVASYVTSGTGLGGLCGLKDRPSVFNRVSIKREWIKKMLNKYS